jgi:hypothetical protein
MIGRQTIFRLVPFALAACVVFASPLASAQSSKAAIAETAFQRGKELLAEGKPAEACPKFEESHRLDPSVGALLNLGRCYQQLGRTASAWVRFKEAATLSRTLGQTERETVARDHANELEPKLSRLRVDVTKRITGMQITRNGEEVGLALLGDPLPVDPGEVTVEVTAPGYKKWSTKIEIGKEADLKSVVIPALVVDPTAKGSPAARSATLRTTAFIVGGAGVAVLGVGAAFGGLAMSDQGKADPLCPNKICSREGYGHIENAQGKALISSVSMGVGAAALGTGLVLFLVSRPPKDSTKPQAWIVPSFDSRGGGASLIGSF